MSNKTDKPKQTAPQLIAKMKSKGITFKYTTEEKAAEYLTDKNNYLRTAAYRKNFQKYNNGSNIGKYINISLYNPLIFLMIFVVFYHFSHI